MDKKSTGVMMKKNIYSLMLCFGLVFGVSSAFSLSHQKQTASGSASLDSHLSMLPNALVGLLGSSAEINASNTDSNARKSNPWDPLPLTPVLPETDESGYAEINNIKIWYAAYGELSNEPVILIHESYANSNYWGELVQELRDHYRVIVLDTRGNGRSSINDEQLTIHLMASDVLSLMDYLKINKAAMVGWGDGANIGIDLAINHPNRVSKLFAFGGNSSPASDVASVYNSDGFLTFVARGQQEYVTLSPTPTIEDYNDLSKRLSTMWGQVPNFSKRQLEEIDVPTLIADGDKDGAISFDSDTVYMSQTIPHAGLLIEPNMNHFGVIQNPKLFNESVKLFLEDGYLESDK